MKQLFGIYWATEQKYLVKKAYYTNQQAERIRQTLQHWLQVGRIKKFNITCLNHPPLVIQFNHWLEGGYKHSKYDKPKHWIEIWSAESLWDQYFWLSTWQHRIDELKTDRTSW